MAIIWKTTDRLGRTVALSAEALRHIRERHPELVDAETRIREAINLADEIVHDRSFAQREIHYRHSSAGPRWFRVVVHYRPSKMGGWVGDVISAHVIKHRNRNEVLLWPSKSSE